MNAKRLEKIKTIAQEKNIQLVFLTSPANIYYLTGFFCNPYERFLSLLVFLNEEPVLICPEMEVHAAKNSGWKNDIIGYSDAQNPWKIVEEKLATYKKTIENIAIEQEHLTVEKLNHLKEIVPQSNTCSMDEELANLRLIKSSDEIEKHKEAARLSDVAIEIGVQSLKEGISELEVQSIIESEMKKNGIQMFEPLILFGKKTADPHGGSDSNKLKIGDFVLFDLGVIHERYYADMTRTFIFGEATKEQREIYETVLKSQLETLKFCKPGIKIGDIDKKARGIIEEHGYGEYFIHRTGHGLGIEVHESPSIHGQNEGIVKEGMVITVEPGIYIPDLGGVRIEDDVLITNQGAEILTNYPKELQVI